MKKNLLLILLIIFLHLPGYSTQHIITNTGNAYTPESITINVGDTVIFQLSNEHDAREVSQATWNANSGVALPGGFQTPFGGGMVLPDILTEGTHYFVCTPHAFLGMKGTIIVQGSTNTGELKNPELRIFPNPAQDFVHIQNYGTSDSYHITDITGRIRLSGVLAKETSVIDITQLSSGVYFVRFNNENGKQVKFLKK